MISYTDTVNAELIRGLVDTEEGPCCSIVLPLPPPGSHECQESQLRFANALRTVKTWLADAGVNSEPLMANLERAAQLRHESLFWSHQSRTLAIYLSPHTFRTFQLPLVCNELIVVSEHFHIKPLLAMLHSNDLFFVLSLSQKTSELFAATRNTFSRILFEPLPSMEQALFFNDPEAQLQFHTQSRGYSPGERREALFFGHGADNDDAVHKDFIGDFFRRLDPVVTTILAGQNAPLVLAGVEYLHPLYRRANHYQHLVDRGVHGNFTYTNLEDLHERALGVVEPHLDQEKKRALMRFREEPRRELALTTIEEIIAPACFGAVQSLFIAEDEMIPGVFDPSTSAVQRAPRLSLGESDLTNLAATHTFRNGGAVYVATRTEMPLAVGIAAHLRFPYTASTGPSLRAALPVPDTRSAGSVAGARQ
jgi:hypothetical protein